MKIVLVGAGQVGSTIVEALHAEHDLTVIDTARERLEPLAYRFDLRTIEANGASRKAIQQAGTRDADLFIACTSRDEVNLVACSFARVEAPRATTVIRTSNVEYIDLWHEGRLDVDFAVSSEVETAHAVSRSIGMPSARQTDVFADGQVQIVEFEIAADADTAIVGRKLSEAPIPDDSRVIAIIRGDSSTLPGGNDMIEPGDRIVVIGSPTAAREWSTLLAPDEHAVEDVVVFGAGQVGAAIARALTTQGIGVRVIEPDRERAREVAEELPECRVYNTSGIDVDFLERERIGRAQAAVFAMKEDAKNHYAATLARVHGVRFTIAVVHDTISTKVYELSGVDVTINPRAVTAEEIVRFAHDPRTQQVAMLEGDRYEVLDITTKPTSEYVGLRFRDMPIRGALIGAIVRDGRAIFPRSDEVLQAGDRVIVFTETSRVARRRARPVTADAARAHRRSASAGHRPRRRARAHGDDDHLPQRHGCSAGGGRDRLRRGVLAVPRRRRAHGRRGLRADAARSPLARPDRLSRGVPRGLAHVAPRGAPSRGLPYLFAGEPQLSRPVDALFEGMSGFSTTGATVVADVESLDRSLLLWRQLSQWLGGMGIIVLALAVLPRLRIGGRQMFESELPGPEVDQLAERIRDTARRLWLLYIALTLVLVTVLLLIGFARPRRPAGSVRGRRARAHDDAARGLLDRGAVARALRAASRSGSSRSSWRSPGSNFALLYPGSRSPQSRRRSTATRRRGCTARSSSAARCSSSSSYSRPTSSPARRRCDRRSSRRRRS